MSEPRLTTSEVQFLREALNAEYKISSIRLREGEHQLSLAKTIASFQLELCFPDVKDIIRRLYGEGKTTDVQLVRKVQTILKKMEKSNIVKILPKKKPWELQKYALSSFKFQDVDKNITELATDGQIKQAENLLNSAQTQLQKDDSGKLGSLQARIYTFILALIVAVSYITMIWDIIQPAISPIIFVSAFSIAIAGSVVLGMMLSRLSPRAYHDVR